MVLVSVIVSERVELRVVAHTNAVLFVMFEILCVRPVLVVVGVCFFAHLLGQ